MSNNPFNTPRRILENAHRHVTSLHERVRAFLRDPNNSRIVDRDPETGEQLEKIRYANPVPDDFKLIAADAITNLRDVLDNAVYASVIASGIPIKQPKKIKFPFGDTHNKFLGEISAEILPDVQRVICEFEPDTQPHMPLWLLNYLANTKKHRWNLTPCHINTAGPWNIRIDYYEATGGGPKPVSEWDSTKNELTYLRMPANAEGGMLIRFPVSIAFDDPAPLRAFNALGILRTLHERTGVVLGKIEGVCRDLQLNV